mmetsp:Transcript_28877/g.63630  ORF Transcript_28877/g.63630 Transcript_28877/m.63630 type:complete len:790 (-) Transcript_28877:965-3334(-)
MKADMSGTTGRGGGAGVAPSPPAAPDTASAAPAAAAAAAAPCTAADVAGPAAAAATAPETLTLASAGAAGVKDQAADGSVAAVAQEAGGSKGSHAAGHMAEAAPVPSTAAAAMVPSSAAAGSSVPTHSEGAADRGSSTGPLNQAQDLPLTGAECFKPPAYHDAAPPPPVKGAAAGHKGSPRQPAAKQHTSGAGGRAPPAAITAPATSAPSVIDTAVAASNKGSGKPGTAPARSSAKAGSLVEREVVKPSSSSSGSSGVSSPSGRSTPNSSGCSEIGSSAASSSGSGTGSGRAIAGSSGLAGSTGSHVNGGAPSNADNGATQHVRQPSPLREPAGVGGTEQDYQGVAAPPTATPLPPPPASHGPQAEAHTLAANGAPLPLPLSPSQRQLLASMQGSASALGPSYFSYFSMFDPAQAQRDAAAQLNGRTGMHTPYPTLHPQHLHQLPQPEQHAPWLQHSQPPPVGEVHVPGVLPCVHDEEREDPLCRCTGPGPGPGVLGGLVRGMGAPLVSLDMLAAGLDLRLAVPAATQQQRQLPGSPSDADVGGAAAGAAAGAAGPRMMGIAVGDGQTAVEEEAPQYFLPADLTAQVASPRPPRLSPALSADRPSEAASGPVASGSVPAWRTGRGGDGTLAGSMGMPHLPLPPASSFLGSGRPVPASEQAALLPQPSTPSTAAAPLYTPAAHGPKLGGKQGSWVGKEAEWAAAAFKGAPCSAVPPPLLVCPLTCAIMHDPVVAADGFMYERDAIISWFRGSRASPVTGQMVEDTRVMAVLPVRIAAQQWCMQHGIPHRV